MDRAVLECLHEVFLNAPLTKSDFARTCANEVAMLACLGLITTHCGAQEWGNTWRHTHLGFAALTKEGLIS